MPSHTWISVPTLLRQLGTPDAPQVVDVCIDEDFNSDPYLIPGSSRQSHTDLTGLLQRIHSQHTVIVCQKGLKLSQGVAAWLRAKGRKAYYLDGGMFAWRDHTTAYRIAASALPIPKNGCTHWVTTENPNVDQLASAWLVLRFFDPEATILFVEPSQVQNVADRFDAKSLEAFATPLAAPNKSRSFSNMIQVFDKPVPALVRMATTIVEQGLDRIRRGFVEQGLNDTECLTAMLPVFDALYADAFSTGDGIAA